METKMIDYGTFEKKKTYGNQNNFLKLFLVRSRPCPATVKKYSTNLRFRQKLFSLS